MKRVVLTILAAFALVFLIEACTDDHDQTYEQNAIDNEKVKEGDI